MQKDNRAAEKDDGSTGIINRLKSFQGVNKILTFYCDETNTDSFYAGYLIRIEEMKCVLIKSITPYGKYDGYLALPVHAVYRIEYGGKYHEKLEKLYPDYRAAISFHKDKTLLHDVLSFAYEKQLVCAFQLYDSGYDDVVGYIVSMTDENIIVELRSEYGEKDGVTQFYLDCITILSVDAEKEAMIKELS